MELELTRTYSPKGTNGELIVRVSYTIELPWLQNQKNISCIPEGRYELRKRYTEERKNHLIVMDVPGRDGILIHPANDAQHELLGCIAPVTTLTGPGMGSQSRLANEKLKAIVLPVLDSNEKVFLTIKSKSMNIIERVKAPTPKFFKVLRNIGLTLAAVSAAILTAPVTLPVAVVTVAGYLAVAGTVATAVSQTAVEDVAKSEQSDGT